jgi:hypothetical protein
MKLGYGSSIPPWFGGIYVYMAHKVSSQTRFVNGIADFEKEGIEDTYYFGRCIDHRSDPRSIKLLPKTSKESGSVVTGLVKWPEIISGTAYLYDNTGNIYKRTTAAVYSLIHTTPDSHGNGMAYFAEDDYLYYTSDKDFGRYGPVSGTPRFNDDFLGSQGGTPLNTNSLQLVAASSQYASRADTATLSITGDITLECYVKPTTLPSAGGSMTLISKWDESGATRSYKFDIATSSSSFGDGSDGALTISSNTTDAPIDSACSGTVDTYALTATNTSFAAGQKILIHQTRGTNAGTYQETSIASYTAGTITTVDKLKITYSSTGDNKAQVLVGKQYSAVTINSSRILTAKAWDGTTGGILYFFCSGTFANNGAITATGKGFRGGLGTTSTGTSGDAGNYGWMGEGSAAASYRRTWTSNDANITNGSGGEGGGQAGQRNGGGGGGGNGTVGGIGTSTGGPGEGPMANGGDGGVVTGSADLTTALFGGGGGGGGVDWPLGATSGAGGAGGGFIHIRAATTTNSGTIASGGSDGVAGSSTGSFAGGGAGGAGGSILFKSQTATLGTLLVTATGGTGGTGSSPYAGNGGNGGDGRIHLDYSTSYTGTTNPTLNATLDSNLSTNTGYILRFAASDDGTASDTLSYAADMKTDIWQHCAVSWDASASTATFYLNGVSLGTNVGSKTGIHDNASTFQIGMNKNNAGNAANFYNGLMDSVRVWNVLRTAEEILINKDDHVPTDSYALNAYYKLNGAVTDATANANNLTASGSPTYSTDVPFPAPTTRQDIDKSATTAGDTYTPPTSISETDANKKSFTPAKDPQKSISVLVAGKGTGDWTITVHDQYNNTIASKTLANAVIITGYQEFIFDSVWRIEWNATYHFHVTSTVADGTVTTTNNADLSTVSYRTYFQFLVNDDNWHPIAQFLTGLVVGNERYVATYEATLYNPNKLIFPAGWNVRCFGQWREYLAIGMVRGSSILNEDKGRIYFWDGIAPTYNFFVDVPEGGVNAILGTRGILYFFAGYTGDLLAYRGGDYAERIRRVPKMTTDKYVDIYPATMVMWRGLLHFGVAGDSNSANIGRGVYSYGAINSKYQDSLSFDFIPSTGNYGNTIKIGMATVVSRKLLISYQDNISYGVDVVDLTGNPYSSGQIEFLISDNNMIWKEKTALTVVADFLPLESGESVDIGIKQDRASTYSKLGPVTTAGETKARLLPNYDGGRNKELQLCVDLATTAATSPRVTGVTLEVDENELEKRV